MQIIFFYAKYYYQQFLMLMHYDLQLRNASSVEKREGICISSFFPTLCIN